VKLLDESAGDFLRQLEEVLNRPAPDREPEVVRAVTEIIEDVRTEGDEALFDYARKLDKIDLDASNIEVSKEEIEEAAGQVSPEILESLEKAYERIKAYHIRQLDHCRFESFEFADSAGMTLGMRVEPLGRVGVYVPGGKAAYPSSVLMGVVPAKVAGVGEVIMVSPQRQGDFHPLLLAAAKLTGVDRIFRVGGAHAVAALAYGTESIPEVDIIVGPGNAYVACAKRMVYGAVDIDMVAGPSEILVISDGSANPAFVAADLLSQAEHDESARPIFVTTSQWEADAVIEEVNCQLELLERREIAREAVEDNGLVILVESLDRAVDVANRIAPEHLEIMCENPRSLLDRIRHAGAIFIGHITPEPVGDYIAGPNHILPTGGSARYGGPLGVYDFFRQSSVIEASKEAFLEMADDVVRMARAEELGAHAQAVLIRLEKEKPKNER